MVLQFVACCVSSSSSSPSPVPPARTKEWSQDDQLFYEFPSPLFSPSQQQHHRATTPAIDIPLRSSHGFSSSCRDELSSPLSTSAESLSSIKSSCSTRSSAEREAERVQRRRLLDLSLRKISPHTTSRNDMPLRRHLLVFNTIKVLQRDLELLDDEDLYSSLMDTSSSGCADSDAMEVDEWRWLGGVVGGVVGGGGLAQRGSVPCAGSRAAVVRATEPAAASMAEAAEPGLVAAAPAASAAWDWCGVFEPAQPVLAKQHSLASSSLFDAVQSAWQPCSAWSFSSDLAAWAGDSLAGARLEGHDLAGLFAPLSAELLIPA